ncbi:MULTISPECIES: hypothetical protein [Novosphingobium]|uniref:hypothetical protein n=1 Tax=Novosphingobium TaxID=165696 RepID=UPI002329E956|nr:hypothetical protein [Novosphingobium resinovorum]GLK45629.1 hypothetical protein GCM10017612_35490 [Novosphingobium resinovorum]
MNSTPFGGTVETGNPSPRPCTATALDLAVEHYMGRDGYASLGAFYKRMDSFITSATTLMPYSQTGLPTAFLYPGRCRYALQRGASAQWLRSLDPRCRGGGAA